MSTIGGVNLLIGQLQSYSDLNSEPTEPTEPTEPNSTANICDVHVFVAPKETPDYQPISTVEFERMWNIDEKSPTDIWVRNDDGTIHTLCSGTSTES